MKQTLYQVVSSGGMSSEPQNCGFFITEDEAYRRAAKLQQKASGARSYTVLVGYFSADDLNHIEIDTE